MVNEPHPTAYYHSGAAVYTGSTPQSLPEESVIGIVSSDYAENLESAYQESHGVGAIHHVHIDDTPEADQQAEIDGDGYQAGDLEALGPSASVFPRSIYVPVEGLEVDSGSDTGMNYRLNEYDQAREYAEEDFKLAESQMSDEVGLAEPPSNMSDWRKEVEPLGPLDTDTVEITMNNLPARKVCQSNR